MYDSVTVVITTFNSTNYIKKTLESVFDQSAKVKKIIIIDDNSSDLSKLETIIKNFNKQKQIKIDLISNDENLGPGHSRNIGWSKCQTKYVAFLDDDDYWHKDKIKIQLDIFNSIKNVDLVASKKKFKDQKIVLKKQNQNINIKKISFAKLLFKNYISTSSVVLKVEIKERFLNTFFAEDYFLWLKILKQNKNCYFIDSYLCEELDIVKDIKLSKNLKEMSRNIHRVYNLFFTENLLNNFLIILAKIFCSIKISFKSIRVDK